MLKLPLQRDVVLMKDLFPAELWHHAKHCYSQGIRGYHTFTHAQDVMQRVMHVESLIGFRDFKAAMLSALFHDAVYVAGASTGSNEDKSYTALLLATVYLKDPVWKQVTLNAKPLILATANHLSPRGDFSDWDTCLFMDCDMMGFAHDEDEFAAQNRLIDVEFGQDPTEPTEVYLNGRIWFLELLRNRGVFLSPPARRSFEFKALNNIDAEIKRCKQALTMIVKVEFK